MDSRQPFTRTRAVILQITKTGEADIFVTAFAEDYGKIRFSVRGIRKSLKRDRNVWQSGTVTELELYNNKRRNLKRASLVFFPETVAADYDALLFISYIIELFNTILPDDQEDKRAFQLLTGCLEWCRQSRPGGLLLLFMKVRMLDLLGILPDFNHCANCGEACERFFWGEPFEEVWCQKCHDGLLSEAICRFLKYSSRTRFSELHEAFQTENELIHLDRPLNYLLINYTGKTGRAEEQFYKNNPLQRNWP